MLASHSTLSDVHGLSRLYDVEVVELAEGVSFLLVLPPVESVCLVPGQRDELTSRADCLALPVQIFEVVHMGTYQRHLIARYARISSILETDTVLAQHANREVSQDHHLPLSRCHSCHLYRPFVRHVL